MRNSLRFSVIVPTFNRPLALEGCLSALCELNYSSKAFEVVVVNDDGPPVEDVVEPFLSRLHLRVLNQKNTGPGQARNNGAAVSSGEFLVFLDDDCRPTLDWLIQWEAAVAKWPENALGGGTRNELASNLFSSASQTMLDYLYNYYPGTGYQPFVASNNLCVPAALYREMGGFSREFRRAAAEDRDFCDAWLAKGYRIGMVAEAVVHHAHHLNALSFWRQHLNYGLGAAVFHRTRARRRGEPLKMEPLSFYTGMLLFPLRRERPLRGLAIACLLVMAQAANAAGFFAASIRHYFRR
jgi:glycosyltransferase involved in cell wall biosynthesis